MPIYSYRCPICTHGHEEYQRMSSPPEAICPVCGASSIRQIAMPGTGMKEYDSPIELFSIALEDQDKIRDFARQCPDVEISDDPDHPMYGVPIARTRHGKLQALRVSGFTETN